MSQALARGPGPNLATVPPRMDAINAALRIRRQQLAMAWVPQLGTRVRSGVFQGLDLGSQLLHRPAPLTRLLGLAHAAWLDQVLALCEARSCLLHLGAPDGFIAAGLLQAGCLAQAWVAPTHGDAAQALAADTERLGLQATLHPLPPQPGPDPVALQALASDLEARPHLLCVAEDGAVLAQWLSDLPASTWQRCTLIWPAGCEAELSPQALDLLHARFGPRSGWQWLAGAEPEPGHADGVLAALDATDQALVRSDAGPPAWLCARGPGVAQRRRTLVCTYAEDKFIVRLLDTVQRDTDDAFDLDVLVYRDASAHGTAAQPSALAHRYPPGVRVFQLSAELGPDGAQAMHARLQVLDRQGHPVATAADFLCGYQRFAVWSIGRANAALLQWLSAHHGRERVMVLVSDDEIDLRHKAQQYLATGRADLAAIAHERFPPAMEQAFEAVRHFWIVRDPWEQMLRQQRRSDLVMHQMILPINSAPARVRDVQPPDDAYVLMLHPKPSLPRDVAFAQLEAFIARWQVDRPLRVLTLRNDMGSGVLPLPGGRGQVQLQVYPAPLPLHFYYELMAGCHGLMLVPRGGMTSTFEAVRMGMDLFDDGTPFSPNRSQLRNCLGLHVHGLDSVHALHGQHVASADLRQRNRRRLAAQVSLAIDTFRRWFVVAGPVGDNA